MLAPSSLKNVFKIYIYLIPLGLKNTYTLSKSIYSSVVHNNIYFQPIRAHRTDYNKV